MVLEELRPAERGKIVCKISFADLMPGEWGNSISFNTAKQRSRRLIAITSKSSSRNDDRRHPGFVVKHPISATIADIHPFPGLDHRNC